MYGLLANAGRREDNAALGGQVAHISAAEADLLRRLGGAGSVNPITGLPEYWAMGFGPSTVASATSGSSGSSGSSGPGPMGIGPTAVAQGLAAMGLGTGSSAPGSTGTGSSVTSIGEGAVAADGGLGFMAVLGEGQGNYGQSMGDGGTTGGTNQGLSFSPLANSTYGRAANMANANIAADSGLVPGMSIFGQLGHVLGKAATTGILGFLGDSGALGPAVQAMVRGSTTSTYGGEGSSSAPTYGGEGSSSATFGGPGQGGLLPSQQIANLPQGGLLPTQADLNQIVEDRQQAI